MKLYFRPFACSLAARIALEEAELDAEYVAVPPGGRLADGRHFTALSPMGYVPAIETPGGFVLTEGPAVLAYIAGLAPEGVLAPPHFSDAHYRMLAWLNFIATELHKGVFAPLMAGDAGKDARAAGRARAVRPFELLSAHLATREHLEGGFSVADAYLLAVLNWSEHAGIALGEWPVLHRWREALRRRPSVARAMAREWPLLKAA
ncbi:glutathione S-transferase N-terminal domain-containing protein [Sphingomonas canadensis]|uniref:Glutathione S-transferase N-terminal domain-containing protein n=1 Tax=Sphingomonas canadensis TaxID=1219257 RepID=A0ABW3H1X9_9SPHN|nr:glutathione S-transferase N-terminal domain-containing protein [Sphingomonas canadensis]MCW3834620.1 glutathione S-transferase N-terminal domain-containing protein [Sphingomonas canadensis]